MGLILLILRLVWVAGVGFVILSVFKGRSWKARVAFIRRGGYCGLPVSVLEDSLQEAERKLKFWEDVFWVIFILSVVACLAESALRRGVL